MGEANLIAPVHVKRWVTCKRCDGPYMEESLDGEVERPESSPFCSEECQEEQAREDWKADCKKTHGRELRGEKWHWCSDWDYMPIDETCKEFEVCTCYRPKQQKEAP